MLCWPTEIPKDTECSIQSTIQHVVVTLCLVVVVVEVLKTCLSQPCNICLTKVQHQNVAIKNIPASQTVCEVNINLAQVFRHHIEKYQTFQDKLSRGITGEGCKSATFDCIPQPEQSYFHALCDVPLSVVMNFKRETMNKQILLFITFVLVLNFLLPAAYCLLKMPGSVKFLGFKMWLT